MFTLRLILIDMKKIFTTFISDTHVRHSRTSVKIAESLNKNGVEVGDLLVCTGDIMSSGYQMDEVYSFINWFRSLPFKYKVFCPGNHDRALENMGDDLAKNTFEQYYDEGVRYLQNEWIELEFVDRTLKLYGTGDQPIFYNWAFNRSSEELEYSYESIPEELDILLTHCPPYGTLDCSHLPRPQYGTTGEEHLGSEELKNRLESMTNPPKYHVFGHIHGDGGKVVETEKTTYINASVCDEGYSPSNEVVSIWI